MISGRRPLKSLGQNFLVDGNIIAKIIACSEITPDDCVLEVGPGRGALTDSLARKAGKLIVVEYDHALAASHAERFAGEEKIRVVDGDILAVNLSELLEGAPQSWKVVANLPYNISTAVLFRMLEVRRQLSRMVLMLQKEVGDRLVAAPATSDYGVTTVLLGLWFDMRREFLVHPGCFHPSPRVDSAVLSFVPRPLPRFDVGDEELFRRLVKGAFAMRRKTLYNCLKKIEIRPVAELEEMLEQCGIDGKRRGETLSMEEFARLSRSFSKSGELP